MMERIFNEDEDTKKLQSQKKFNDLFDPFKQQIEENTATYQKDMKDLNKKKKNAIMYCEDELRKTEREAEKESISLIEAFKSRRKHKFG
jgi:dsDNA-specific endonuclease/ATPase MutS2